MSNVWHAVRCSQAGTRDVCKICSHSNYHSDEGCLGKKSLCSDIGRGQLQIEVVCERVNIETIFDDGEENETE